MFNKSVTVLLQCNIVMHCFGSSIVLYCFVLHLVLICMSLFIGFFLQKPITSSPRIKMHKDVVARHGFSVQEWEGMANLLATIACTKSNFPSQGPILGFDWWMKVVSYWPDVLTVTYYLQRLHMIVDSQYKYCWTAILHMKGVLFLSFNTPRRKLQLLIKTLSKPEEPFLHEPQPPSVPPPALRRPTKKAA